VIYDGAVTKAEPQIARDAQPEPPDVWSELALLVAARLHHREPRLIRATSSVAMSSGLGTWPGPSIS
jgi:hypothetical protein